MWTRIFNLIIKEFLSIWRDPKSRLMIIMPPLLQLIIFAHAATMEVKNIDMAVVDRSNTYESRELISRFQDSRWFRHIYKVENTQQLTRMVNNQRVLIGMDINNDFAKNINAKRQTQVQVIVDGRQTNSAGIAGGYATQIIAAYENEINPNKGAQVNLVPRNWFNPNLEYIWYTLVSMIAILALIVTLLLTALSIAKERELGTFEQLIVSPLSPVEILIGKTVPPLVISVLLTCFMTVLAIIFFKLPFVGNIFVFLFSMILSLLAIVGVGLYISSICKTQQQAILLVFTFNMPAVLLSGYLSPVDNMPIFVQYLTYINPVRFFITITNGLFLKKMPFEDVMWNLVPIIIISIITLTLATRAFKRNLD